jgi:hypothetical protein
MKFTNFLWERPLIRKVMKLDLRLVLFDRIRLVVSDVKHAHGKTEGQTQILHNELVYFTSFKENININFFISKKHSFEQVAITCTCQF